MNRIIKTVLLLSVIFATVVFAGCNKLELDESVSVISYICSDDSEISPEDFVTGLTDGITVTFRKEPDLTRMGSQPVKLLLQQGKKKLKVKTELYVFHINEGVEIEKGSDGVVYISDFITDENVEATFANSKTEYTLKTDECEEKTVSLICNCIRYSATVKIVDTTPPEAKAKTDFTVCQDVGDEAIAFVTDIKDESEVTAKFKTEPDFSKLGKEKATVILTDEYGNSTETEVEFTVIEDNIAPEFEGLDDMYILVNGTASYKTGVTVTDNRDGEITEFTVDSTAVNKRATGTYTVIYTATDSAGNKATAERKVIVRDIDETKIDPYCDKVLKEIIDDSMTVDEKIEAVWQWSKNNISFVGSSDKTDELHGAYEGFSTHAGDCYTYYAVNKYMLDKLGIENTTVRRIDGTSNHWWNLVKFSDGKWYFMDSCPLPSVLSGTKVFKLTVSELKELNDKAYPSRINYYKYDTSLYTDYDLAE